MQRERATSESSTRSTHSAVGDGQGGEAKEEKAQGRRDEEQHHNERLAAADRPAAGSADGRGSRYRSRRTATREAGGRGRRDEGGEDSSTQDASGKEAPSTTKAAPEEKKEPEEEPLPAEILNASVDEVAARTRLLENDIKVMRSENMRLMHEQTMMREKIKDNADKIKQNKVLPYLVGNVVEVSIDVFAGLLGVSGSRRGSRDAHDLPPSPTH